MFNRIPQISSSSFLIIYTGFGFLTTFCVSLAFMENIDTEHKNQSYVGSIVFYVLFLKYLV